MIHLTRITAIKIQYANKYECDYCGAVAIATVPENYSNAPPPGWAEYGVQLHYECKSQNGTEYPRTMDLDICDTCAVLPYEVVIREVIRRYKERSLCT